LLVFTFYCLFVPLFLIIVDLCVCQISFPIKVSYIYICLLYIRYTCLIYNAYYIYKCLIYYAYLNRQNKCRRRASAKYKIEYTSSHAHRAECFDKCSDCFSWFQEVALEAIRHWASAMSKQRSISALDQTSMTLWIIDYLFLNKASSLKI